MSAETGARLADLSARLVRELDRLRAVESDPANAFRGLYIDEGEVAGLLSGPATSPSSM